MDNAMAQALAGALRGDRCIFGYSGLFPDAHSARLIKLGEAVLEGQKSAAFVRGRLGYVLVEAYQNVVRHRTATAVMAPWGSGRASFLLRCRAKGQRVATFNVITRSTGKMLDDRLTELGSKSKAELKAMYMQCIQRTSDPDSRGAGLGLIEMVRRSDRTPHRSFTPMDADLMLFGLALELGETVDRAETLADDDELRGHMLEQGVHACYAGHWSSAVKDVLLDLMSAEVPVGPEEDRLRAEAFRRAEGKMLAAMGGEGPVLLALHGKERTVLSIGGLQEAGQADPQRGVPEVMAGSGAESPDGNKAPMLLDVPW